MSTRRAIALLALLLAAAWAGGWLGSGASPVTPGALLSGRVERVIDGDTIVVALAQGTERVRYIGVDTPESVKPGTPVQCFAKAATAANAALVGDQPVKLRIGAEARDRYGRALAYVYRAADGRFVNGELVARGFARTLTIAPNDALTARFEALQAGAQRARLGLWAAC